MFTKAYSLLFGDTTKQPGGSPFPPVSRHQDGLMASQAINTGAQSNQFILSCINTCILFIFQIILFVFIGILFLLLPWKTISIDYLFGGEPASNALWYLVIVWTYDIKKRNKTRLPTIASTIILCIVVKLCYELFFYSPVILYDLGIEKYALYKIVACFDSYKSAITHAIKDLPIFLIEFAVYRYIGFIVNRAILSAADRMSLRFAKIFLLRKAHNIDT